MGSTKDLRDQAYTTMKSMILSGQLKPGVVYTTVEIAEMLHVSRTPAREAMVCLHVEGWMREVKKMGFCVPEVTIKETYETAEAMICLETFVISQIQDKDLQPDFDALQRSIERQKELVAAGEFGNYFCENSHFHKILLSVLNNGLLERNYDFIAVRSVLIGLSGPENPKSENRAIDEHQALVTALMKKDYKAAQKSVRTHYHNAISRFQMHR